jgi:hypothetical protein
MECPICYETETVFDGKCNSDEEDKCKHYICVDCCQQIYNKLRKQFNTDKNVEACCPLCRENWTLWLLTHYNDIESDED